MTEDMVVGVDLDRVLVEVLGMVVVVVMGGAVVAVVEGMVVVGALAMTMVGAEVEGLVQVAGWVVDGAMVALVQVGVAALGLGLGVVLARVQEGVEEVDLAQAPAWGSVVGVEVSVEVMVVAMAMAVAMEGALNLQEETNWILLALFKRIIRMAFLQVIMFSTSEI